MLKKPLLLILGILGTSWLFAQISLDDLKITYQAKERSLEQVFKDLETSYPIRFSYATEHIKNKKVQVQFNNASLPEVLDQLLGDKQIDFKVFGDNVLLRKAENYKVVPTKRYNKGFHLKGKVVDYQEKASLPFATVSIEGTNIGTYTDEQGQFDLEIPEEHQDKAMIVHYLGYRDRRYLLRENKDEFLVAALTTGSFGINEVTIVNREKAVVVSNEDNAIRLNKRQLQNTTSGLAGSDLSRQLQLLPGINASDDTSAEIKIRGSNSDETLMILDGMPLYHADHYFGVFNAINTAFLEEVNLYKNVFPIEYGGKTAGVVELKGSQSVPDSLTLEGEINLLNTSLFLNVPFGKKQLLSLAARTTITDVSNTKFNSFTPKRNDELTVEDISLELPNQVSNPSFRFFDVNGKYLWQPSDKQSLSFNFYGSGDKLSNAFAQKVNEGNHKEVLLENTEKENWSNIASSLLYKHVFSEKWGLNTSLFVSNYQNEASSLFELLKQKRGEDLVLNDFGFEQANGVQDVGVDVHTFFTQVNSSYKLGTAFTNHQVDYAFEDNGQQIFGNDTRVLEWSAYGEYALKLENGFQVVAGLRGTSYTGTNDFYWSPRLSANWKLGTIQFKGAYSYYQQFLRELHYEYRGETKQLWVNADDNQIPVLQSQNIMLGASLRLGAVLLDVEAYQKDMKGVLEYANVMPGTGGTDSTIPRDYRLFEGEGLSRGIDVMLSAGYKNYDSYVSYTLSKTTHQFQAIARGRAFPSEDDRRHQLKWVNEYHLGAFSFGMDYIYSSGRPYTNVRVIGDGEDIQIIDPRKRLSFLPAYRRLDLGASYKFKIGATDAILGVSVLNALNSSNLKYEQSIISSINDNGIPISVVLGNESNLLSRTWNLSFRIEL